MTRAPSSQALARATASSAGIGAGAPFDDLADFCAATAGPVRSSGACCANAAAAAITETSRSAGRRKRLATKSSPFDCRLRRRIGSRSARLLGERPLSASTALFVWRPRDLTGLTDIGDRRLERGAEAVDDRVHLGRPDDE